MKDYDFTVPESGVPGISLLVEIGKWEQRRAATPQAIKELCEKHKIDSSEVNSLEQLKEYVLEDEIELTLYRAKAAVDFPSLVRYMQSSMEPLKDRIDEILSSFSQLHELLRVQYLILSAGETVLQIPPLHPNFANPKFFRKTGPVATDIKNGKVLIRSEVKRAIKNIEEKGILLLYGKAASGKTALARIVAHMWFEEGKKVRFVQLRTEIVDLFRLIEEITRFGEEKPQPLLVIEDAHLLASKINQLISKRSEGWPKLLITSRNPDPQLPSQEVNHFATLPSMSLDSSDPSEEIIQIFFKTKGWKLTERLKKEIKSVSGDNLWILSYALTSSKATAGKRISHDLVLGEVRKDLYDLNLIDPLFPRLLIALSVLDRYDFPTDLRYIYQRFSDYPKAALDNALKNLVTLGEAIFSELNDHYYYHLPHSTLAELYFRFAKNPRWEEDEIYGDEDDFICDYVVSDKAGFGYLLFSPFWPKILSPERLKRLDKKKLANKISAERGFETASFCFEPLSKADPEGAKALIDYIDKKQFAKIIDETDSLYTAQEIMHIFSEISPTAKMEISKWMNKKDFARRISNEENIKNAGSFIITFL